MLPKSDENLRLINWPLTEFVFFFFFFLVKAIFISFIITYHIYIMRTRGNFFHFFLSISLYILANTFVVS